MTRLLTRILIIGALCWLGYVVFGEMKAEWDVPADSEDYNPTALISYFLITVAMAVGIGVTVSLTVLPAMGDLIGKAIFNPDQKIEKNPHADALAAVACGEYEEAVDAYKKIVRKSPDDMHALSEVARIQCEKLQDYDAAANYLHDFLEEERPPEQTAFLAERLVDVYWTYQQNHELAMPLLRQLIDTMPGTNHAANAYHRIRDIEDTLGQEHEAAPEGVHLGDSQGTAIPDAETEAEISPSDTASEPQETLAEEASPDGGEEAPRTQ